VLRFLPFSRRNIGASVFIFLLLLTALVAGLLPLVMPLGMAAGGVLETGQVEPIRWWLGGVVAVAVYVGLSGRMAWGVRLWWLAVLVSGLALVVALFGEVASSGQKRGGATMPVERMTVGVMTALPLFWTEGQGVAGQLDRGHEGRPLIRASRHELVAIDHADAHALARVDALMLAQPRLLQPQELVAIDDWVRNGGRAVIFADPLLMWPSALPPGDARRAPMTSLLDPLLTHWGLRLEPVAERRDHVERWMLASGHVLVLAGASRFTRIGGNTEARCTLAEGGLMASCSVGKGQVRLVADADLLDDRLWLADLRWPERAEAHASDAVSLMDAWLANPSGTGKSMFVAPRRAVDDEALVRAMRWAIVAVLVWVGLGALGHNRIFRRFEPVSPTKGRYR
tara:strand:+ start:34095 stop:35288 length:1194 start_codon:yes stop_codon:yes gene_type:complete